LLSPVNGDKQLWEERGNDNRTADISHGFHSLQQLISSFICYPRSFIQVLIDLWRKKRDLLNMAVGRRQGLVADIPFLTFWGPLRRIYQILVHFSRPYCFSVVCRGV